LRAIRSAKEILPVELFSSIPAVIVLAAAIIAAVTDVWKFKIHNALTLPLLVTGLVYHAAVGGRAGLATSLLGVLFGFGVLLAFYVVGGMGAGDVKLMAAIGAWLGMPLTFYVFIASSLAAGAYAVVLVAFSEGGIAEVLLNFQILWVRMRAISRHLGDDNRIEHEVKRDDRRRRLIPFAAMVAVGVVMTLLWLRHQGNM
jgi:prepilin peptidase CpaA